MPKCKICGSRLVNDATKCPMCGTAVSVGNSVTVQPQHKSAVSANSVMKSTCPQCGAEILGEHRLCPHCSTKLQGAFQFCPEYGGNVSNFLRKDDERKKIEIFFLVDTSGSVEGDKIASLNDALRELVFNLQDISAPNTNLLSKIAVLEFASGTEWITPMPVEIKNCRLQCLEAGGCTDLGDACRELDSKLNTSCFLKGTIGFCAPIIILVCDGEPTDDFENGLSELKWNRWFDSSIKVAFAVGADANMNELAEFTGNRNLVIPIMGKAMMKQLVPLISIVSAKISSQNNDATGNTYRIQQLLVQEIQQEMQRLPQEYLVDEGW